MAEMHHIATKLLERTAEGKIPWKSTTNPDFIGAKIGNFSVVVASQTIGRPPNARLVYRLVALDENGEEMDSISSNWSNSENNSDLKRLFQSARESAHKAKYGGKLDQLLAALEEGV